MNMAGAFHTAGDVDRLYVERRNGGRGLRSVEDMYEIRTVALKKNLDEVACKHSLLEPVEKHEKDKIRRLGEEFLKQRKEFQESSNVKQGTRKEHEKNWEGKVTHGYLAKKLEEDETVDISKTNKWMNLRLTAHVEGFITAAQEQELNTKETQKRREKDPEKKRTMDTRCRICNEHAESVYHMICSCPVLAPTLYLDVRHNQAARILYQEVIKSDHLVLDPPKVTKLITLSINTTPKVEKNRRDIIIWNKETKICQIVEVTVPLDRNLQKAYKEKQIKYILLITRLEQLYKNYKYTTIIITVGALGAIPKLLEENQKKLYAEDRIPVKIHRIQKAALLGTVRVCKTILKTP